jgi:hypothetical protein
MVTLAQLTKAGMKELKARDVIEILEALRRRGLTMDDLINIGGEDRGPKVRQVENVWGMMAARGVVFGDLEQATGESTVERPSARRGEGADLKAE